VVELGQGFLSGTDLVTEFRRLTGVLPTAQAETVLLAVLDGPDVLYLARHDGSQPIRLASDVGRRLPAVVTALGKAMLADLPDDELELRLAQLGEMPVLTPRSHRTVDALRADLAGTRARGYAVDDEQNTQGVTCVGLAVPGTTHPPTAVSATLLTARMTTELRESLVRDLSALVRQLSSAGAGRAHRQPPSRGRGPADRRVARPARARGRHASRWSAGTPARRQGRTPPPGWPPTSPPIRWRSPGSLRTSPSRTATARPGWPSSPTASSRSR
jgi:DNA-binding IclR family transcriptional regulator